MLQRTAVDLLSMPQPTAGFLDHAQVLQRIH
jgi:hypothetical protein